MSGTSLENVEGLRDKIHEHTCDLHITLNRIDRTIAELEHLERKLPHKAMAEAISLLREQSGKFRQMLNLDHDRITRILDDAGAPQLS
jgi:hypothetical protein